MIELSLSGRTRHETTLRGGQLRIHTWRGLSPAVQALLEALPKDLAGPVFIARDPLAPISLAVNALWPELEIHRHDFDAFEAKLARENFGEHDHLDTRPLHWHLSADFPRDCAAETALLALPGRGESLLAKECLEMAHDLLVVGGQLFVATDGSPRWLLEKVREVFGRGERHGLAQEKGAVVTAKRHRPQARHKPRAHPLRFQHREREFELLARPGVFSSRQLDLGTRALLDFVAPKSGARVLDLGCGTGALGLAAAASAGPEGVVLVDSNARAVVLAAENAERNRLEGVQVCLRADLEDLPGGPFDLAMANPPYYAHGRIADSFARCAAERLAPEGELLLVAKNVESHEAVLREHFRRVAVEMVEDYGIHRASQPLRRSESLS